MAVSSAMPVTREGGGTKDQCKYSGGEDSEGNGIVTYASSFDVVHGCPSRHQQ
jgi:hypothetical protein